ncbi:hypothetical protein AC624_25705 [Bacillus sp. FJAT-27238]|nr:hypothetical protein AC624_25705 [Bacillus sp. FJAT-27238]
MDSFAHLLTCKEIQTGKRKLATRDSWLMLLNMKAQEDIKPIGSLMTMTASSFVKSSNPLLKGDTYLVTESAS